MTNASGEEPRIELEIGGRRVTLLGTAHVSRRSAEKVVELIESGGFDAVAVELCASRHRALTDPDGLARLDLFKVLREGKVPLVAANLILGAYQQRLAEQLGIEPGAEQRAAIRLAAERDLPLLLIDREIGTTLRRVATNLAWWKRLELFLGLTAGLLSRERVSAEEVEQLKEGDLLETAFAEFARDRGDLFAPLIDERDRYMAARLRLALGNEPTHHSILAVVGAGHLRGIARYLREADSDPGVEVAELDRQPPPGRWLRRLPWLVVAVILAGFAIGFGRSPELGWQLVTDWVVINGTLSALGALLAAAHPLTIVTAFVAAPITSLNPTIGAGMVTAAAELYLRRPEVGDFARLRHDAAGLAGWWRNRVSRTLLVFLFSTLGSAIGTYVAGFRIFGRLTG